MLVVTKPTGPFFSGSTLRGDKCAGFRPSGRRRRYTLPSRRWINLVVQTGAANDALATLMAVSGEETATASSRNSYDLYQESARRMVRGMNGNRVCFTGADELRAAARFMQAARA